MAEDGAFNTAQISGVFFTSFKLFELWLIIIFIIVLVICKYTTWLVLPFLMCISTTVLFSVLFILVLALLVFMPNQSKTSILYPLVKLGLYSNCAINISGINVNDIDYENTIIIANYPSNFIEYLILPMIFNDVNQKASIVVGKTAAFWAKLFMGNERVIALDKNKNFDSLPAKLIASKTIPIVYPEKNFWNRKTKHDIQEFKSGIFQIAQKLNKKIIIAHVQHFDHFCGFISQSELNINLNYCDKYDSVSARNQMINMI